MTKHLLSLVLIATAACSDDRERPDDGSSSATVSTIGDSCVDTTGLVTCIDGSDCQPNEYCDSGYCLPCYLDANLWCMCGDAQVDPETCGCELEQLADSETDGVWQCFCRGIAAPEHACVPMLL